MNPIKPNKRINWETTIKPEEDMHTELNKILEDMSKKAVEIQEDMLVGDIISIYNGVFETYDEYVDAVIRFNEHSKHQNESIDFDYTLRYTPQKTAITERTFNYIKELKCKTTN